MAKEIRNLNSWIEVAPAPVILPMKPSNSPALETITEEVPEEHDDGSSNIASSPYVRRHIA